jgi:hypothetical protein
MVSVKNGIPEGKINTTQHLAANLMKHFKKGLAVWKREERVLHIA